MRAPDIQAPAASGALQMPLFDERDMASIAPPDFPGEGLIVCRNPDLAKLRTHKRQELPAATERDLEKIAAAVGRQKKPLRGKAEIGLRVGKVVGRHKTAKHFDLTIGGASFSFARKHETIAAEAALDGVYGVRAAAPEQSLDDAATAAAYKSLAQAERAFRSLKTIDLHVRPIHHWNADRVRAQVFLCMLALCVEQHMREKPAPMLYDETDHEAASAARVGIVAKAERSPAAKAKEAAGRAADGLPVHSLRPLLADLATYSRLEAAAASNEE